MFNIFNSNQNNNNNIRSSDQSSRSMMSIFRGRGSGHGGIESENNSLFSFASSGRGLTSFRGAPAPDSSSNSASSRHRRNFLGSMTSTKASKHHSSRSIGNNNGTINGSKTCLTTSQVLYPWTGHFLDDNLEMEYQREWMSLFVKERYCYIKLYRYCLVLLVFALIPLSLYLIAMDSIHTQEHMNLDNQQSMLFHLLGLVNSLSMFILIVLISLSLMILTHHPLLSAASVVPISSSPATSNAIPNTARSNTSTTSTAALNGSNHGTNGGTATAPGIAEATDKPAIAESTIEMITTTDEDSMSTLEYGLHRLSIALDKFFCCFVGCCASSHPHSAAAVGNAVTHGKESVIARYQRLQALILYLVQWLCMLFYVRRIFLVTCYDSHNDNAEAVNISLHDLLSLASPHGSDIECHEDNQRLLTRVDSLAGQTLALIAMPTIISFMLPMISVDVIYKCLFASLTLYLTVIIVSTSVQSLLLVGLWFVLILVIVRQTHFQKVSWFLLARFLRESIVEAANYAEKTHANEMRHMIANVAHDLKTPLSSFTTGIDFIQGIIEETRNELIQLSPMEALDSIQTCITNIRNTNSFMLMTINRCIDFTKASKGLRLNPRYDTIDLSDTLQLPLNCMQNIQNRIEVTLQAIPKDICTHIITDKQWLQENLLCLLSNAVKYSASGEVTINLHLEMVIFVKAPANHPSHGNQSSNNSNNTSQNSISGGGGGNNNGQQQSNIPASQQAPAKNNRVLPSFGSFYSNNSSTNHTTNSGTTKRSLFSTRRSDVSVSIQSNGQPEISRYIHNMGSMGNGQRGMRPQQLLSHRVPSSMLGANAANNNNNNNNSDAQSSVDSAANSGANAAAAANAILRGMGAPTSTDQKPVKIAKKTVEYKTDPADTRDKETYIRFEIEDTGIGMSEEAMSSLFNPFKQTQRLAGGTGLGLYSLAKRLEAMNGRYGVMKRRDGKQGSLFWFAIPYKPDEVFAANALAVSNESSIHICGGQLSGSAAVMALTEESCKTDLDSGDMVAADDSVTSFRAVGDSARTKKITSIPALTGLSRSVKKSSTKKGGVHLEDGNSVSLSSSLEASKLEDVEEGIEEEHDLSDRSHTRKSSENIPTGVSMVGKPPRSIPVGRRPSGTISAPTSPRDGENSDAKSSSGSPSANQEQSNTPIVPSNGSGKLSNVRLAVSSTGSGKNSRSPSPGATFTKPRTSSFSSTSGSQYVASTSTSAPVANPTADSSTRTGGSIMTKDLLAESAKENSTKPSEFDPSKVVAALSSGANATASTRNSASATLPGAAPSGLGPLQILLVDDAPAILKMTGMMLRRLGHTVSTAENGEVAVKMIEEKWTTKKEKFDVVLMDLQMPVMDGLEATRRIRKFHVKDNPDALKLLKSRDNVAPAKKTKKESESKVVKDEGKIDEKEQSTAPSRAFSTRNASTINQQTKDNEAGSTQSSVKGLGFMDSFFRRKQSQQPQLNAAQLTALGGVDHDARMADIETASVGSRKGFMETLAHSISRAASSESAYALEGLRALSLGYSTDEEQSSLLNDKEEAVDIDGIEKTWLEGFPHQIILGVSACSDHDTTQEAYSAGVDHFIGKPFNAATFAETMAHLFKQHGQGTAAKT